MSTKINTLRTNLFLSLFALLFSCSSIPQKVKEDSKEDNNVLKNIDSQYHPNVIGISKIGLIKGRSAMESYLADFHKEHGSFVDFISLYKVSVYQALEYEIGLSKTAKGGQFTHILIWSKENDPKQKIADVVFEKTAALDVPAELATARKKWVELCGKKNAKKLVSELYTEDAIYYNRGRILTGHDQLSQEYSYMNNSSYTLQLNPEHIEMVAEDIIYEIGICSGSYNLPYVLVWKKQLDGNWKVYMDSNY